MTSKLNINWLNKCWCGNRIHTVETVRGSHVRLFEDDAVKCNACGREGVIQTCYGIATVLWETDEERAESVTMTKSTITRERIQRIIRAINSEAYDEEEIREWLSSDEIMELSRMALVAMDSEPVEMPLDYLQGHKDGLEWAARLAEANHPDTGDWLYDDPIELAKAIRKGPDMPPVQPVADSEPDRNPVLAYADSYRDMAKQGVESVPIWSVITDLERNIAPLYRHAQPAKTVQPVMFIDGDISTEDADKLSKVIREFNEEDERPLAKMAQIIRENPHPTNECDMPKAQPAPVVPDDVLAAIQKVARIRLDLNDFDGDRRGIADCLGDAEEALIEVVNRRAAMLSGGKP